MTAPPGKPSEQLAALNLRAKEQKQQLAYRLGIARNRLRPSNLAQEAGNRALDLGLDNIEKARKLARAHPAKVLAAAVAIGAVLGRKPLMGLLRTGWTRFKNRKAAARAAAMDGESED